MTGFDVIVLGGGPAGEHCAARLADGGLQVAIVERELLGGECSYWGCIPSKTLVRPGEALQAAREAAVAGGSVDVARGRSPGATSWSPPTTTPARPRGRPAPASRCCAAWAGSTGRAACASATRPTPPATSSSPLDRIRSFRRSPAWRGMAGVWTNREATGLTEVPRRLLVLGGGPVGLELGQALVRMGASVAIVEGADRLLAREPAPLGEALAEVLAGDGIELQLGRHATSARREGEDFVLELADGTELRGDRLLVATGRRPRTADIGLETVGLDRIEVDATMRVADGLWAIGDVTGIWPLTYVGKYQGRIAAANILGNARAADYTAVPRVVFTDPQAAAVGEPDGPLTATVPLAEVPRTSTYTRAYAEKPGFMTLVSDGERLTGAYAVGPEAGEWLQQATLAIRARVPLAVMEDVIQPFPTFSEAFLHAMQELTARLPVPA